MSLGIFSFDFAAIINSLSSFIDTSEPELVEPANTSEASLDRTEAVLQSVSAVDSSVSDALMATALNSSVTSVLSLPENVKKEPVEEKSSTPVPTVRVPSSVLDEETKREIERLIKSLQTSIIYGYQSTDIINDKVALNNVVNFSRKEIPNDTENKQDLIREERKREDHKLKNLQEELRKAIMKNNSDV